MLESNTFEAGFKLDDRVELVELIGRGAMGSVYKATQQGVDRAVAVKTMHRNALTDVESIQRFFREAKVISALDHPNIVRVYAVGMAEDQPYMLMDFIEGETLGDLIADNRLTADEYLDVFIQVAGALAHAHTHGVVHRDIKPRNILIQRTAAGKYIAKIADFGIARLVEQTEVNGQKITKTGAIIGSPTYMSPEQCTGRTVDHRTDLYSLGCVMYEAATGSVPFKDDDPLGLIGKHVLAVPRSIAGNIRIPELREDVAKIVSYLLNKDPADRYRDADALKADLEALRQGKSPPAADVAPRAVAPKDRAATNTLVTAIVMGTIVLLGSFFIIQFYIAKTHPRSSAVESATPGEREVEKLYLKAGYLAKKRDYLNAYPEYSKAFEMCKGYGVTGRLLADVAAGLGRCEMELEKYSAADEHLRTAMTVYRQEGETRPEKIGLLEKDLGHTNLKWKRRGSQAVYWLSAAYGRFKPLNNIDYRTRMELLRDLAKACEKSNRIEQALAVYPELIKFETKWERFGSERAKTLDSYADLLDALGEGEKADVQRKLAREARQSEDQFEDAILNEKN